MKFSGNDVSEGKVISVDREQDLEIRAILLTFEQVPRLFDDTIHSEAQHVSFTYKFAKQLIEAITSTASSYR